MIFDAHAYSYPPLGEANGYPTVQDHLRHLQLEIADHHQPVWRLRDGKPGDNSLLAEPGDLTVSGLKSVDFRAGDHGRFIWTVDDEVYAKQYLPPSLPDLAHPPEMLIAQMDYVGVDHALLHADAVMGFLNDHVADCVAGYPDRLFGLVNVPEWEIEQDPDAAVAEVERAYQRGLHGLQFLICNRYRYNITESWDSAACRPFWDGVAALGKPIFFSITPPCPGSTVEEYVEQLRVWTGWLQRYPEIDAVLTHGICWRLFLDADRRRLHLPDEVFIPFRESSAKLELLFQISLGNVWDFPFTELHPTIVQLVEEIGSERLMWGSDMPNVERHCTYRQTLDTFRTHCQGIISDDDIQNIIGGTAARLFKV